MSSHPEDPPRPHLGARCGAWLSAHAVGCLLTLMALLMADSVARTLRLPNDYAKGHWLHNFKHGFIPRGLPGELAYALFQFKSTQELSAILALLAWSLLACLCLAILAGAKALLTPVPTARALLGGTLAVFASSPFMVMTGHLAGYFDHIVQLFGLLAIFAVSKGKVWVAGLLSAISILVHEMYVMTVMPAVFFTLLLFEQGQPMPRKLSRLAQLLTPAILAALLVLWAGIDRQNAHDLTRDIARYGVVDSPRMATVHLSFGISKIFEAMLTTTAKRVLRSDGPLHVLPALLCMTSVGLWLRYGGRAIALRIVFVLTSVCPWTMLLTVWDADTGRMSATVLFGAFCNLCALGLWQPHLPQPSPPPAAPSKRTRAAMATALAIMLVICIWHLGRSTRLMDRQTDRQALLSARRPHPPLDYRCESLPFANANFELGTLQGWTAQGKAFAKQPVNGQPRQWRRRPWNEGRHWIGTYDRRARGGRPSIQGDKPKGRLESDPFVITKPYLSFLIGGGRDANRSYVSLKIDGQELRRATGRRKDKMRVVTWDLSQELDKVATLVIVDDDDGPWGHINADGFCLRSQAVATRPSRYDLAFRPSMPPLVPKSPDTPFREKKEPRSIPPSSLLPELRSKDRHPPHESESELQSRSP